MTSPDPPGPAQEDDGERGGNDATRSQIRGSSLLLVGRIVALGLAFAAQVVTVRYLSRTDYGVFAYALSLVTFGETLALFGFDRAVGRFIPLYDERDDPRSALGVIMMVLTAIGGIGTAFILVVVALAGPLTDTLDGGPSAPVVLAVMAGLAPMLALDRLGTSLLAIYTNPQAIFFRKYLLAPGLRLLVVLAVVGVGADVVAMAAGYLVAGILGVGVYAWILVRSLRDSGRLRGTSLRTMRMPWREIATFTLPLLTTDIVFATMTSIDGIMLGAFAGADEVASLRAVQPVARLNQLVLSSFGVLFTPMAARLFARGDGAGVNDLYWRTATWVAILTFPLFAVSFVLAEPVTTTVFGNEYQDSGQILALLSAGFYATAALGFNGMVLNVYMRLRQVVVVNVVAAAANVGANLVLIPLDGARGAATATMLTFILHNVMKQLALRKGTDVDPFDRDHLRPYAVIAAGVVVLVLLRVVGLGVLPAAAAVLIVSLGVLLGTRSHLQIADTFPELAKLPLLGRLMSGGRR